MQMAKAPKPAGLIAAIDRRSRPWFARDRPIALVTGICVVLCSPVGYAQERAWLGVYVIDVAAPVIAPAGQSWRGGARVAKVEGPAAAAGFRELDVIVEFDGRPIADTLDLVCQLAARQPGDAVRLTLVRERQQLTVTATLDRWPERPPVLDCGDAISAARPGPRIAG